MVTRRQFYSSNQNTINQLAQRFSSYPADITKHSIESYLNQFKVNDLSLGLKLLRSVDYYDPSRMLNLTRDLGNLVFALNNNSFDNVLFCPMSTTSGDSAGALKRLMRMSMTGQTSPSLTDSHFLDNVLNLSEEEFTEDPSPKKIVLIDHFIGSGESVSQVWEGIKQWENENYEYYVAVLVGYEGSIRLVEDNASDHLKVISVIQLQERARAFHNDNRIFTSEEKEILKKYCVKLGLNEKDQFGYMNGQSLVIFSNRISDNVLPILHHSTDNWNPLFPRNF